MNDKEKYLFFLYTNMYYNDYQVYVNAAFICLPPGLPHLPPTVLPLP